MSEIVINALRAKRAEIAGYIHDLEGKARAWRARLAHLNDHARSGTSTNKNQTEPQAHAQPSNLSALQNEIKRIASALEGANNKQPSAAEKKYQAQYLKSQKHMAKWAGRMFWAAVAEMLVTIASVYFVWRTLAHATKSSERQLRAYIFINTNLSKRENEKVKCRLTLKNFGQTPAYAVEDGSRIWVDEYPKPKKSVHVPLDKGYSPCCIGPTDDMTIWDDISISAAELDAIKNEKMAVWASAVVTYSDAFGRDWHMIYVGFLTGEQFEGDDRKLEVRRYEEISGRFREHGGVGAGEQSKAEG